MSDSQMAPSSFTPDSDFAALETPRVPGSGGSSSASLSITALARFEFEPGKGNEGTKILMVEWEDDHVSRPAGGSWHVSWEGKKTVLPADEQASESTRRFYFLLPPGVTIPPVVTLTYEPPSDANSTKKNKPSDTIQLNPLPAIFPAELGATARTAGKKGVLHTIWAKKRLQVLEKEIREECLNNAEGVALHMAIQEKEWIESNFGVSLRPESQSQPSQSLDTGTSSACPMAPTTPISPTSGRKLGEKLKGLRLETSEKDLAKRAEAVAQAGHNNSNHTNTNDTHPLSPESADIAVSSFNSFRNNTTPVPAAETAPSTATTTTTTTKRTFVAHHPPASIQQAQQDAANANEFGSMDSIARTSSSDSGDGDDLFAKALSPRTPDIPRSPFSFAPHETMRYVAAKKA